MGFFMHISLLSSDYFIAILSSASGIYITSLFPEPIVNRTLHLLNSYC